MSVYYQSLIDFNIISWNVGSEILHCAMDVSMCCTFNTIVLVKMRHKRFSRVKMQQVCLLNQIKPISLHQTQVHLMGCV